MNTWHHDRYFDTILNDPITVFHVSKSLYWVLSPSYSRTWHASANEVTWKKIRFFIIYIDAILQQRVSSFIKRLVFFSNWCLTYFLVSVNECLIMLWWCSSNRPLSRHHPSIPHPLSISVADKIWPWEIGIKFDVAKTKREHSEMTEFAIQKWLIVLKVLKIQINEIFILLEIKLCHLEGLFEVFSHYVGFKT